MKEEDMLSTLKAVIRNKNRVDIHEFEQFKPLFEKDHLPILDPNDSDYDPSVVDEKIEELQSLSVKWSNRISLYDPVEIIENNEVVAVLPPALTRVKTLNEIEGIDPNAVVNGLNNALDRSDNIRDLATPKIDQFRKIFTLSRSGAELKNIFKEQAAMEQTVVEHAEKEDVVTDAPNIKVSEDGWE